MEIKHDDVNFKTWLKGMLHANTESVNIKFTKKDGSERAMVCTLDEARIPSDKRPKQLDPEFADFEKTPAKSSDEALRVFDLEKQAWRSFRWDSIKSVNIVAY
jgi:hypothetical protein